MLHLQEEKKVEKKDIPENNTAIDKVKKESNDTIVKPIKNENNVKYNGLHAFDVSFRLKDKGSFKVLVIARTIEAAKNRVKDITDVEEILNVTKYKEIESKRIVEKEKKAGVYTKYMKRLD